jgi:hypothetical protein
MRRFAPTVYLLAGMVIGGLALSFAADANQPNMQNALVSLKQARAEMQQARPNKGGHRERALGFINSAIAETEAGINYAGN